MEAVQRIRKWNESFLKGELQGLALTHNEIHRLISNPSPSQADTLRQADRYLLIFCLLVLALLASVLRHPLPTVCMVLAVVLAVIMLWGASRAAVSLYYQWQMRRLRHHPYQMLRYSDRFHRLSRFRRRWLNFLLWPSQTAATHAPRRMDIATLRTPSYSIAACIFLLIAVNAGEAFASSRSYVNVTTNTSKTATVVCCSVNEIINHL